MRTRLVRQADLTDAEQAALLGLLDRHFEGVSPAAFARDLAEKDHVLLVEDERGVHGFSTLLVYETRHAGEDLTVVTSGDTIVEREAWGSSALARGWIGAVRHLRALHPRGRLYWLLLTSGFRTYRLLPVFWRDFHPRFDADIPPGIQDRLSTLARARFGSRYQESGIVRLATPQVLRGDLALVPPARQADPHVAFFLARNPGWIRGDELVCLAELEEENLTPAGRRMWDAGPRALVT